MKNQPRFIVLAQNLKGVREDEYDDHAAAVASAKHMLNRPGYTSGYTNYSAHVYDRERQQTVWHWRLGDCGWAAKGMPVYESMDCREGDPEFILGYAGTHQEALAIAMDPARRRPCISDPEYVVTGVEEWRDGWLIIEEELGQ